MVQAGTSLTATTTSGVDGARHGELVALAAAVAFAGKAIFVKLALAAGADPIALLSVRMAFALPVFAAVAWWARPARVSPRQGLALVALGLLGYHAAAALDFAGLQYVSAGLERVVLYVHPTLVVLFAAALNGQRIASRELLGIAVAWLGLLLAVGGDLRLGATSDVALGVALVLGCAVCYAGYLLGAESLGRQLGALYTASVATAVSAVTVGAQVAATRLDELLAFPRVAVGWALILALVSTVLPVGLLAVAIRSVGPARASTIGMVGPTIAAVLGVLVLGEPLSALQLGGGLVVVAGVSLARARAPVDEG